MLLANMHMHMHMQVRSFLHRRSMARRDADYVEMNVLHAEVEAAVALADDVEQSIIDTQAQVAWAWDNNAVRLFEVRLPIPITAVALLIQPHLFLHQCQRNGNGNDHQCPCNVDANANANTKYQVNRYDSPTGSLGAEFVQPQQVDLQFHNITLRISDTFVVVDLMDDTSILAAAGVQEKDAVLAVNGENFTSVEEFAALCKASNRVQLQVVRLPDAPVLDKYRMAVRQRMVERVKHETRLKVGTALVGLVLSW